MRRSSADNEAIRNKIIGIADQASKKSYYPQLQEKIQALDAERKKLIKTVRLLETRERSMKGLLDEKDDLLHEIHHRVKNNFQLIASMLNLGESTIVRQDELRGFIAAKQRIAAMALVYEQLLESDMLSGVNLCDLSMEIIKTCRKQHDKPMVEINSNMECSSVFVDTDTAIPYALILHEAASNAFTHAFLDGRGNIKLEMFYEDPAFFISLEDEGPGFKEGAEPREDGDPNKLGITLIHALSDQLGGAASFRYRKEGDTIIGCNFSLKFIPKQETPASE